MVQKSVSRQPDHQVSPEDYLVYDTTLCRLCLITLVTNTRNEKGNFEPASGESCNTPSRGGGGNGVSRQLEYFTVSFATGPIFADKLPVVPPPLLVDLDSIHATLLLLLYCCCAVQKSRLAHDTLKSLRVSHLVPAVLTRSSSKTYIVYSSLLT